jgi:hypothetical protein
MSESQYVAFREFDEVLDSLLPLREEIQRGDLRPLYLAAWIARADCNHDPDEELEAPVRAGLKKLTPAQHSLGATGPGYAGLGFIRKTTVKNTRRPRAFLAMSTLPKPERPIVKRKAVTNTESTEDTEKNT